MHWEGTHFSVSPIIPKQYSWKIVEMKSDKPAPTSPEPDLKAMISRLKVIHKNRNEYETVSIMKKVEKEYNNLQSLVGGLDLEKTLHGLKQRLCRITDGDKSNNHDIMETMKFAVVEIEKVKNSLRKQETTPREIHQEWVALSIEEKIFEDTAMANIMASYDNLESPQMRVCLLLCSIFPENAVIKKRLLIYWWIGEGLISSEGKKTADEVGEDVFQTLITHGLLKPYKPNPYVNACTIHPWTRHLLISMAKEARLFHFDSFWTATNGHDMSKSRRACLVRDDISKSRRACLVRDDKCRIESDIIKVLCKENSDKIKEENSLLTVFNMNEKYLNFLPDRLSKLRKLVVLQLGRWQSSVEHHIEVKDEAFLKGLGTQKHLKYLSLRGISLIPEILPCISGLSNLEILDLRACHNLETLPAEIVLLKKLTHLDASECYLLESMPKGLEKLINLQVLKGFVLGRSIHHCRLRDLSDLNLRKLSVYIGSGALVRKEDFEKLADFKELENFKTLLCLRISWGFRSSVFKKDPDGQKKETDEETAKKELEIINSFSSPPKLVKLDLRGHPQEDVQIWLNPDKLKKLKKLYIRGGAIKSLVMVCWNKWPDLETLRLKYLENFEITLSKLKLGFARLKYLELKRVKCSDIDLKENNEGILLNADEIAKRVKHHQASTSNAGGEAIQRTSVGQAHQRHNL